MLNPIYSFFGMILKFFSSWVGNNYLFGLVMFAILIKIVMLPFGIKQQKTSIRQAKLRPREMAVRKKYAGREDKATQQKMQQEIMELYQQEGYNPAGGCLPMLIQMVIILLLYQAIIYPLQHVVGLNADIVASLQAFFESAGTEFTKSYTEIQVIKEMNNYLFTSGKDVFLANFQTFLAGSEKYLSNAATYVESVTKAVNAGLPNFDLFGINNFLAEIPSITSLWTFPWTQNVVLVLVPLLNFGTQFGTMKLTRKWSFQPMQQDQQGQSGCMMKMMDWMMPAMTLYIAFVVPAAIGIYWLFNNFLGVIQSYILHKTMPLPQFTEEDYKAAEKELKANTKPDKLPKAVEGVRSNPNSLHTIDFEEEDYAVLPDYDSVYDKPKEETKSANPGEPNKNIGASPLKKKKK
ncbi:MAG: YidC/Oxa1 family membrane protein insertase [Clostridia bacterium]|nr:YidC/Oxa1 family membrane protein insertase [Clostridia bacterium]